MPLCAGDDEEKSSYAYLLKERRVAVKKNGETTVRIHNRIKILKPTAVEHLGEVSIPFNSYREKAVFIGAHTLTAGGRKVAVEKDDVRELPAAQVEDYPMYSDAKELSFSMPAVANGVTIDYEVEIRCHRPVIDGHAWGAFRLDEYVPVKEARYVLTTPKKMQLKVVQDRIDVKPTDKKGWLKRTRTWVLNDLKPHKWERGMPPFQDVCRAIRWTSVPDWAVVRNWYSKLIAGQGGLDGDIAGKVKELTATCETDLEKIRALYVFLQDNFRYVGVELGRSAYEPHAVTDSFRNRFGDCKDQALLLTTMLGQVGIKAHVALVRPTYHGAVRPELPGPNQFNHAIVYVPRRDRPLWLDCTVKYYSEQSHPASLDGALAFIVRAGEDKLTRIKPPQPAQTVSRKVFEIELYHDGFGKVKEINEYVGRSGSYARTRFRNLEQNRRKKEVERRVDDWEGAHLLGYGNSDPLAVEAPFREWIEFEGTTFFTPTGSGLNTQLSANSLIHRVLVPEVRREDPKKPPKPRRYRWERRGVNAREIVCRIQLTPGMKLQQQLPEFEVKLPEGTVRVTVTQRGSLVSGVAGAYANACSVDAADVEARARAGKQKVARSLRHITLIVEPDQALANHDPVKARKLVRRLLKDHPQAAHIHHLAASVYDACGRLHDARTALRDAIRLDPGRVDYYEDLAATYAGIGGNFGEAFNRDEAVKILRRAVAQARNKRSARDTLAFYLEHSPKGIHREPGVDLQDAVAVYQEILKDEPDDADCLSKIAECYFAGRDYKTALTWFQKLKDKHPRAGGASGLWTCRAFLGETGAAISEIRTSRREPRAIEAELRRVGGLLMQRRHYPQAIALFQDVLRTKTETDRGLQMIVELLEKIAAKPRIDYGSYCDLSTPQTTLRSVIAAMFSGEGERFRKTMHPRMQMTAPEADIVARGINAAYGNLTRNSGMYLDLCEAIWELKTEKITDDMIRIATITPQKYTAFSRSLSRSLVLLLERHEGKWYVAGFGITRLDPQMAARVAAGHLAAGEQDKVDTYIRQISQTIGQGRGLREDSIPAQLSLVRFPDAACRAKALIGTYLECGRSNEAIGYLRFAAEQVPDNPVVQRALAVKCAQAGRLTEACRAFQAAVKHDGRNKRLLFEYMNTLREAARYEEAMAVKQRLAELIPSSRLMISIELELLSAAGKYTEAAALLEQKRAVLGPEMVWGQAVELAGKQRDLKRLKQLARDMPGSAGTERRDFRLPGRRRLLAACYLLAGDLDTSVVELEKACIDRPGDSETLSKLALNLLNQGDRDNAASLFQQLLDAGLFAGGRSELGYMALCFGKYAKAAELIGKSADILNGDHRAYALLFAGVGNLMQQKTRPAQTLFKQAIDELGETDWPRPHLQFLAGEISFDELIQTINRIAPRHERENRRCEALYYAGAVAVSRGDIAKAKDYFRQTVQTERRSMWEHRMALSELKRRE